MIYNLEEQATLYEAAALDGADARDYTEAARGTLRDMIAMCLAWGEERFGLAHIVTANDAAYGPGMIREVAEAEDIAADGPSGHPG